MSEQKSNTLYDQLRFYTLCGIGLSIVISQLLVNSMLIIVLLILWLVKGNLRERFAIAAKNKLFIAYTLLLIVNAIGIIYAPDKMESWKNTESKLSFLVLPLIFSSSPLISNKTHNKVLLVFTAGVTLTALYCLAIAGYKYGQVHDTSVFFYHDLVSPLPHHAVYFSVFTFIGIAWLLFEGRQVWWLKNHQWLYVSWILFLLVLMVLLSSKMALVVLLIFFGWFIVHRYAGVHRKKLWAFGLGAVLAVAGLVTIDNPVKRRFADMANADFSFLSQEKFTPKDYFNGLQFRMLLWRITYEILDERDAWLLGVSPSEAQAALRDKYIRLNMYQGDKAVNDPGYLDYNCHNQLLQTSLQSGLIGLASLLFWCVMLAVSAWRKKSILLNSLVILIFCFFFTDSVFERQYGVILVTFFPLLLLYSGGKEKHSTTPPHS